MSIGNEGHKSSSALAVTVITLEVAECRLIFLGGGVIMWAEDVSIMRQTMMILSSAAGCIYL